VESAKKVFVTKNHAIGMWKCESTEANVELQKGNITVAKTLSYPLVRSGTQSTREEKRVRGWYTEVCTVVVWEFWGLQNQWFLLSL
jgi:hypothetical protein